MYMGMGVVTGVTFLDCEGNFYPWIGRMGGSRNHGQHVRTRKERERSIDPVVFSFTVSLCTVHDPLIP